MHDISRLIHTARTTPWAILPEKLAEIRSVLYRRAMGEDVSASERESMIRAAEDRGRLSRQGAVAVIPVMGTIAQRMNMLMAFSGGTSTEILGREIRAAAADPEVSSILLNVDSPGGSVYGVTEVTATVMDARKAKPVIASVNALSASAAYCIASAATEICVTPSGEVGSIGVFAMHVDESEALQMEGVKVSLIHAGKYKVEGNPFEPLSDEARAKIQADVDYYYDLFVKDVARGRGVSVGEVREKYGEGRVLQAKDALSRGMVDRIETFDETAARLTRTGTSRGRKAEDLLRGLELDRKKSLIS